MTNDEFAAAYGYVSAIKAGGLVFFSGQVGADSSGNIPADPETQYRLAFAALEQALAAEGCSKTDLVELMTFHTDYPAHMDKFMAAKKEFLGPVLTTWTAVGVAALGTPETLVEIKATARSA